MGDSEENNLAKYETIGLFLSEKKNDLETQAKPNYAVSLLLRITPPLPKNFMWMVKLT